MFDRKWLRESFVQLVHSTSYKKFHNILQPKPTSTVPFPEFELVLDAEDHIDSANETDEQSESRRMQEYEELIESGKVTDMPDVTEADLMAYAQNAEDVAFGKFKKRIALNNDQVLRYNRGGVPLWISSKNTLDDQQVPPCELCQSKRVFEFQVCFVAAYKSLKVEIILSCRLLGDATNA